MNNNQKSSSLDDLLTNLEREHKNKQKFLPTQEKKSSSQLPSMNLNSESSDSIDNYLAEVQSNIENKQTTKSNSSQPEELFNDIQAQFKQKKSQPKSKSNTKVDEDYLDHIAQNFQGKTQKQDQVKQQEKLKLIQQEELNKQRHRKQLTIKAKEWLKNLDPNSDEGFWFEQFAYSYDSKLEAAIDYLEALDSK